MNDSKKYKHNKNRSRKYQEVDVNMRGFLCSCNNREKECVRESFNILNKYVDEMSPATEDVSKLNENETGDDIQEDLAKEIEELQSTHSKGLRKFYHLKTGAKNLIFIKTTLNNPTQIAESIVTDVHVNGEKQTRFLIRLIPIETTCKAFITNLEKAFEPLAEKYFKEKPLSFSVIFNHRMNNSLSRDAVVKMIAEKIGSMRSDHKVDLKQAEISVVIEVIKSIAMIGVIPNYLKYKKYNLVLNETPESNSVEGDTN